MASLGGHYAKFYPIFLRKQHSRAWTRRGGGATLGLSMLSFFENPDAIDRDVRTVKQAEPADETGMDRLRLMFSYDEFGEMSTELNMVIQGALMGTFTGTLIGGTIHSRESYLKFVERNQATAFENVLEAKKRLQDKVTTGFARGAFMWGWRLGIFCGTFMLCTTTISVYRCKSSVWEYILAGGISGSLYKLKQGPRACLAGGIIGSALGSAAGCASLAIMYLTGTSMEDIRYWQHTWKQQHQEKRLEALRQAREKDMDILTRTHSDKVETKVLQNIEIEEKTEVEK